MRVVDEDMVEPLMKKNKKIKGRKKRKIEGLQTLQRFQQTGEAILSCTKRGIEKPPGLRLSWLQRSGYDIHKIPFPAIMRIQLIKLGATSKTMACSDGTTALQIYKKNPVAYKRHVKLAGLASSRAIYLSRMQAFQTLVVLPPSIKESIPRIRASQTF